MDFDEVREYLFGDEVRTIDWNVTARAGRPFIKKFAEEREGPLLLLVDVSASGHFGSGAQSKRDVAADGLALSATRNNDKVGLVLFTDQIELYIPPKKWPAARATGGARNPFNCDAAPIWSARWSSRTGCRDDARSCF